MARQHGHGARLVIGNQHDGLGSIGHLEAPVSAPFRVQLARARSRADGPSSRFLPFRSSACLAIVPGEALGPAAPPETRLSRILRTDTERFEHARQLRPRHRDARRHARAEPEQLHEVHTAVEARRDAHVVAIDDHAHRLALLPEQEQQRLVDAREPSADVDERDARRQAARNACAARRVSRSIGISSSAASSIGCHSEASARPVARWRTITPKKALIARARAQRAIDALGDGARRADARVDGARVVVAARVRLDAAAHPLGGAGQAVEVGVADDGVDRARRARRAPA